MPKAYLIGNIDVKDMETYKTYVSQVPATVAKYGGRYLVRGGKMEPLEGEPPLPRIVVLEFPSLEQAKAWYSSEEYSPLIKIRQSASEGSNFFVEGYEADS